MRILSVDLETYKIGRGEDQAPRPVVCAVHTDTDHYLVRPADMDWSELDQPDTILLGANLPYDASVLIRRVPRAQPHVLRVFQELRAVDVLQANRLTDVANGDLTRHFSLEDVARAYLGIELEKDAWRTDYDRLDSIPLDLWPIGAIEYALLDSWVTRKAFDAVCKKRPDALRVLAHLTAADWALHEAEINGVHTHPERSRRLVARTERQVIKTKARLQRAGLVRPDGSKDTKPAKAYLERVCARQGVRPMRTATGGISFTAEATERAANTPYLDKSETKGWDREHAEAARVPRLYSEYVSADKLLTASRNLLHGFETPLQTRFSACMETYRTSSRMPDGKTAIGVQMQNPPRASGYRECFAPEEGQLFIGADYAMAELYSLSQVCKHLFGYSIMGDQLKAGIDLHYYIAARIVGCTYEEIKKHPKAKHYRQLGKVANFGLPGGLGAASLVAYAWANYQVRITEDEARQLIRVWKATFTEVVQYLDWINGQLARSTQGRWVQIDGQSKFLKFFEFVHPLTGFIRGQVGYTDGANTGFQSLTAWYGKTACRLAVLASYDPQSPLYGWLLWNFVHDELLMRGPASGAKAAAQELSRLMKAAALEVVPDYPIKVDPWIGDVWSKAIPDNMDLDRPFYLADHARVLRADLEAARAAGADKLKIVKLVSALRDLGEVA